MELSIILSDRYTTEKGTLEILSFSACIAISDMLTVDGVVDPESFTPVPESLAVPFGGVNGQSVRGWMTREV